MMVIILLPDASSSNLEDFQDRIMVSLTSLLVLVTFFSQTTQSIPKTSYVKLIDAWYLSLIVEDFLVIVVLVYIERTRLLEKKVHLREKCGQLLLVPKSVKMNKFFLFFFPTSLVVLLASFVSMFISSF
nr:uncharacterized protein LOC113802683 [Penaeus vannamei]